MATRDGGSAPEAAPLPVRTGFRATLCWSAVSVLVLFADLATDIALVVYYWHKNYLYWSLGTFLLFFIPTVIIQLFSMRWLIIDEAANLWQWISHVCLSSLIYRHVKIVKLGYDLSKSKSQQNMRKMLLHQSDVCVLHLFKAFLQAAPQLLLQLYIATALQNWKTLTVASILTSLCSLSWGIVNYLWVLRKIRPEVDVQNSALFLQITWRGSLLIARISALLIFTIGFQYWIFLFIGLHWIVMTVWIIYQKTDFCPSRPEEILYNCVIGVIYCFCFFNLKEGQARYRMFAFYFIMIMQNIACLFLFIFLTDSEYSKHKLIFIMIALVIGGTLIGVSSMLIFYRWFHSAGPIKWIENKTATVSPASATQVENNQISPKSKADSREKLRNSNLRSLKKTWIDNLNGSNKSQNSPRLEIECTDKKLLLDNWIARAGSPTFASTSAGKADIDTTGVEFYSVVNTPEKFNKSSMDRSGIANTSFQVENEPNDSANIENTRDKKAKIYLKNKRSGICSPIEVKVNIPDVNKDKSVAKGSLSIMDISSQKRRAICSSSQLEENFNNDRSKENLEALTDNFKSVSETSSKDHSSSNEKTSSGSVNFDLDLSFSDINSSDINEFNENIVQKLCLSTLKNIKNVHQDADIQNIQRIALEILKDLYNKGGLKDDQDIESELSSCVGRDLETPSEVLSTHDYENICAVNIAREAWGLRSWRGCADMGASPPPPPLPARRHPPLSAEQSHYINTIAYELAKCEETNCEHRESIKNNDSSVFIAKPYVIDQNGGMFPLATPLEPILEEIDLEDMNNSFKKQQRRCSESALVATIDEIRHDTVTNSPRNVYHRADWDSPHMNIIKNKSHRDDRFHSSSQNLGRELWKEVSKENLSKKDRQDLILSNHHIMPIDYKSSIPINSDGTLSTMNDDITKEVIETYKQLKNNEDIHKYEKNKKPVRLVNVHNSNKENSKSSKHKSFVNEKNPNGPVKEHNLSYEEIMFLSQLVNENNSMLTKKQNSFSSSEDVSNLCISSSLQLLIDQDIQNIGSKTLDSRSNCKKNGPKPRRKFSLLREKFEPKTNHSDEEMLFQSLESIKSTSHNLELSSSQQLTNSNKILDEREKINNEKENLTPFQNLECETCPVSLNNEAVVLSLTSYDNSELSVPNLKEKRSLFLKQVLSPPKINNLGKKS